MLRKNLQQLTIESGRRATLRRQIGNLLKHVRRRSSPDPFVEIRCFETVEVVIRQVASGAWWRVRSAAYCPSWVAGPLGGARMRLARNREPRKDLYHVATNRLATVKPGPLPSHVKCKHLLSSSDSVEQAVAAFLLQSGQVDGVKEAETCFKSILSHQPASQAASEHRLEAGIVLRSNDSR